MCLPLCLRARLCDAWPFLPLRSLPLCACSFAFALACVAAWPFPNFAILTDVVLADADQTRSLQEFFIPTSMLLQRFSCKDSVAQLLDPACCLEFDVWCFSCWTIAAMLRVISPLTAEEKATFSEDEVPSSVKALKQCLALQIGVPRFQLRILEDTNILDDAEPLRCEDVQLVLMKFQAPSHIKDRAT